MAAAAHLPLLSGEQLDDGVASLRHNKSF